MKKFSILLSVILISLSICAFTAMPTKAATATISISTNFGYVGDTVTVSAAFLSGFASGSSITIKFDGTTLTTTPSQVTTDIFGSFIANITIPVAAVGSHSISATDLNNNIGLAAFAVQAPLVVVVSPSSWVMDVGQPFKTFTANASGGSGVYSYRWYVNGALQSGQTTSTFGFSAVSVGSYSITVTVTDSLGTTSAAASVTVNDAPTVSVAPAATLKMDVGQIQMFNATVVGGSGALSYQWYLDGSAVSGQTTSAYNYNAALGPHSIYVNVTDSASTPITVRSNSVSVTVNPALVAPTVSASPSPINQGQTSNLNSTSVSTGTSPYTYQWFSKAPNAGSYSTIINEISPSYSFVTSIATAAGDWSFQLRVTDAVSAVVTSNVKVTVNSIPTVVVSPSSWVMDVGQPFKTFTANASGGSGVYSFRVVRQLLRLVFLLFLLVLIRLL